jgi:hypothetical protein
MPTGRITFPGGLSAPSIAVPNLFGPDRGVRGASISAGGSVNAVTPGPNIQIDYGVHEAHFYAGFVPEIAKANYLAPSNQGRKLQDNYQFSRMAQPRNNPSTSQKLRGYTQAIQVFAASNTWQVAGQTSVGVRAKQPSTKFVSPFSNLPIPVAMPWDL